MLVMVQECRRRQNLLDTWLIRLTGSYTDDLFDYGWNCRFPWAIVKCTDKELSYVEVGSVKA